MTFTGWLTVCWAVPASITHNVQPNDKRRCNALCKHLLQAYNVNLKFYFLTKGDVSYIAITIDCR